MPLKWHCPLLVLTLPPRQSGKVGWFLVPFSLLLEYIRFVKHYPTNNKVEDSQRMEMLRKLYQRAVVNPMNNMEGMYHNPPKKVACSKSTVS